MKKNFFVLLIVIIIGSTTAFAVVNDDIIGNFGLFYNNVTIGNGTTIYEFDNYSFNSSRMINALVGITAFDQSSFTGGNAKIVSTSSGGAASFNGDSGGGAIDFSGNTASIGISKDGTYQGYDYDGAFIFKQKGSNPDSDGEFIFIEESGDWRFALPKSMAEYGTYNPRSLVVAGPSVNNISNFNCTYWGFNQLDCDTSGTGADLGVQDDLQVEGEIFNKKQTITHETAGDALFIDSNLDVVGFDGNTYNQINLKLDSELGNGEGRFGTYQGINADWDFTTSGTPAVNLGNIHLIKWDYDRATYDYVDFFIRRTNQDGALYLKVADNSSSTNSAVKTIALQAGSGKGIGYYGWAEGVQGATGSLTGVLGYVVGKNTSGLIKGLESDPAPFLIQNKSYWDIYGLYMAQGNVLTRNGNLAIYNDTFGISSLEDIAVDNLDLENNTGQAYFASDIEVDGYAYLDGGHGDIAETYHTAYSESMVETYTHTRTVEETKSAYNMTGEIYQYLENVTYTNERTKMSNDFVPEFTGGEIVCLTTGGLIKTCDRTFDNHKIGVISQKPNLIVTHHKHGYPVAIIGIVNVSTPCNKNYPLGESVYAGNQELLTISDAQGFSMTWDNFDRLQGSRVGRVAGTCENDLLQVYMG